MKPLALLLLLCISSCASAPAFAEDHPGCVKAAPVLEQAASAFSPYTVLDDLDEEETKRALDLVRAGVEQLAAADFDYIVLADHRDGSGLVGLGYQGESEDDDVFCGKIVVPKDHWETFKRTVLGVQT